MKTLMLMSLFASASAMAADDCPDFSGLYSGWIQNAANPALSHYEFAVFKRQACSVLVINKLDSVNGLENYLSVNIGSADFVSYGKGDYRASWKDNTLVLELKPQDPAQYKHMTFTASAEGIVQVSEREAATEGGTAQKLEETIVWKKIQ